MIRAVVMPGAGGPCEVREFAEPELAPDSALMRVVASEVCGTDVHLRDSKLAGVPYPIVPGHVSCGRIEKLRGSMRDIAGAELREGDFVTFLDVHKTCNACWSCLVAKASTRCPERRVYGITYGLGDGILGGWASHLELLTGVHVIRLDAVSVERFMAGGCGLPTALHAVDRAAIQIGDTVLVLGVGPVGLSAIAFARASGAGKVLAIGAPRLRLDAALAVGADRVLDLSDHDIEQRHAWILEQTEGRGADVTIEAAGAPSAAVEAQRFTRDAGRVVIVGQYTDHGSVAWNPHTDLNKKHLDVRGCWGSDFSHFYRGVQWLADEARGRPWDSIPIERFGLDRCNEALTDVEAGRVVKALVDPAVQGV
ncbi:MAG: zinc-binding dehydrogenase [Planctomycetes bacterium]|nr:zinc-binding dehydrogenase [Planctomycetota bacterium]